MQSSSTSRLQCEESFCSLSPLEVSPPLSFQQDCTTTISPPQHHYYYPPLPAPHLPSMTGVSPPCQFQISPLFEWNMAPSVEAGIEEYSFFTTTHPQFTPSPPMSRQMFPPPPLHHLYWLCLLHAVMHTHMHTHTHTHTTRTSITFFFFLCTFSFYIVYSYHFIYWFNIRNYFRMNSSIRW